MTLPTFQNQSTGLSHLHFMLAVIIIFKHATFLKSSQESSYEVNKLVLIQAEKDYQAGDIKLKIQQHLEASSQEHTVEQFAHFIMATDIVPSS